MAANLVVLSSSPPRPAFDRMSMSSSPGLPSPSVLIRRSGLMESPRSSLLPRNTIEEFKSCTALPRDEVMQEDRTQKPKPAKMTEPANRVSIGKGKKTTKKGAVLKRVGKQTGINQMKVTKVLHNTSFSQPDGKQYTSKSEPTVHEHSVSLSGANEVTSGGHDLHLNEAMRRRVNWTPPKNTIPNVDLSVTPLTSPTSVENQLEEPVVGGCPGKSFKGLIASFGYRQGERPSLTEVPMEPLAGNGTRKRQWSELANPLSVAPTGGKVSTNRVPLEITTPVEMASKEAISPELAPLETGPRKMAQEQASRRRVAKKTPMSKAPRRKPKTITQQATRPYDRRSPSPTPVLQHLTRRTIEPHKDVGVEITTLKSIPPPKRSRRVRADKDTNKARTTTRRKRSKESGSPLALLSPRSALKKMGEQVVLFGTSSQLAEKRSPSPTPPLPAPSELVLFPSESRGVKGSIGGEPQKRIRPYSYTGGLWSAASRGLDGALMEVDMVDLATTPKVHNTVGNATKVTIPVVPDRRTQVAVAPQKNRNEGWAHVDDNALPVRPEHTLESQSCSSSSISVVETAQINQTGSGPSRAQLLLNRVPESAVATNVSSALRGQPTPVDSANIQPQQPDFAGYSTSQLSSELLSYGFKPIKSRSQMIVLLEKCWEGRRNRAALKTLESSANTPIPGRIENSRLAGGETLVAEEPRYLTKTKQTGKPKNPSSAKFSPCDVSSKASECKPQEDSLTRRKNAPSNGPDPGTIGIVSPKRPRGRPKKLVPTRIDDSPPEDTWSQSREATKIARRNVSPEGASRQETGGANADVLPSVSCTPSIADPSLGTSAAPTPTLSDEAKQQRRFDYITRAVASQAQPENASSMPNFHQKILMYDPIVLEDLAAWLNTKGLADIGVDAEVGAAEVRAWCEQNSVCCLWKENLWRGTRSRHG